VIDALPERAALYRSTHAIVGIDVFRATTTIVTGLAAGRRVYPVASVVEAMRTAGSLANPVLVGEVGGVKAEGFDLNNSPTLVASLEEDGRPLVVLSSAGTQLLKHAAGAEAVYCACFRNLSATARHVALHHRRVALIGAGTKGERRPEDQMACAAIGERLFRAGFMAEDASTHGELVRWRNADVGVIRSSPSADYLRNSQQEYDIEFVLSHLDDVDAAASVDGGVATLVAGHDQSSFSSSLAASRT
jgi:2-phosphosulfolactate phosphatase